MHDWQPIRTGDRTRLAPSPNNRRCVRCGMLRSLEDLDRVYVYYGPTGHAVGCRPGPCVMRRQHRTETA
jgi:hypothetical protein